MLKAISKTMQDIVRLHQESYRDPLNPRNLARRHLHRAVAWADRAGRIMRRGQDLPGRSAGRGWRQLG